MAGSPIDGHARWKEEEWSDQRHCSGDLLQLIGEEGWSADMVGRMEPMVRGHAADTVVRLERLGMLQVEDELRGG